MQYPTISEYAKAIQDAGANLNELAHLTPVLDDHGEPYHISGDFFVVFKMQDKTSGKCYALKCFTEKQEVRAEAYRQIQDIPIDELIAARQEKWLNYGQFKDSEQAK